MKKVLALMTLALMIISSTNCLAAESPPTDYAVWDRMPAESSVEGFVKANFSMNLYSSPRS